MLNNTAAGKTIKTATPPSSASTGLTPGGGEGGLGEGGGGGGGGGGTTTKQRRQTPFAHIYRGGIGIGGNGTSNTFTSPLLLSLNKPTNTWTLVASLVLQILMLVFEILLWGSRMAGTGFVLLLEFCTTTVRNRRSGGGGASTGGGASYNQKRIRSLALHSTGIGSFIILSMTLLASMISFQRGGSLTRAPLNNIAVNENAVAVMDGNINPWMNDQQRERHRQQQELKQQQESELKNLEQQMQLEIQQQQVVNQHLRNLPDVQYDYDGDWLLYDTTTSYNFEPMAPPYRKIDDTTRPDDDPYITNVITQLTEFIKTDRKFARKIKSVRSNGDFVSCQFVMLRFNPDDPPSPADATSEDAEEAQILARELDIVKRCAQSLNFDFNKTADAITASDVTLRPDLVPVATVGSILAEPPKKPVKNKRATNGKNKNTQPQLYIYYNPFQRERYLCDYKIGPKQILILSEECPYPARLFLATPGRGLPSSTDTDRYRMIQNLPSQKQPGLNPLFAMIDPSIELRYEGATETTPNNDYDQCDVPCTSYGEPGVNTLRYVQNLVDRSQTKWTVQQGSKYHAQLAIDPNNWKRNIYSSTSNYRSDIPIPHFSFSEYDILRTGKRQKFLRQMIRHRRLTTTTTTRDDVSSISDEQQPKPNLPSQVSRNISNIIISSTTQRHQRRLQELEANDADNKIPDYSDRIKGALFTADFCGSANNREWIVKLLRDSNMFRIDSIGTCLHNADPPPGVNKDNKVELLSKYMFYLAFENQNSEDYITGELWQALEAGTIPIYFGAPNIEDHAPENSYINVLDYFDPSPTAPLEKRGIMPFAEYLTKVANDRTLYESFHYWRTVPLSEEFHQRYDFTKTHSTCRTCRWAFAKQYGYSWVHSTQSLRIPLNIGVPRHACIRNHVLYQPFIERWRVSDESTLSQRTTSIVPLSPSSSILSECDIDGIPKTVVINKEIQRTIVDQDGVIDMYINVMDSHSDRANYRSKDTYVLHLQTLLAASTLPSIPTGQLFLKEVDKGRFVLQNSHSRLTILSWPYLSRTRIRVSKKGNLEIRIPHVLASASASSAQSTITLEDGLPLRLRFISEDIDTFHLANWYDNYFGTFMTKDFYNSIEPYVYVPHIAEVEDETEEEDR